VKIPILMYHQIDEPPARGTSLRGLIVAPVSFARQMSLLKLLGYQGLSMRDLEPYLDGSRQGKVVGITFDDGYQNNRQHALPILQRHGFTATCYGVSRAIGGTNAWDHGTGIAPKPLMDLMDWQAWLAAGMDVGSHTRTHADLTQLESTIALQEIKASKTELESALGCEVRHFCYPYGRLQAKHPELVQQSGYRTATTTRRGRVSVGDEPFTLRRIMIARATHLALFAAKVMTRYEDLRG